MWVLSNRKPKRRKGKVQLIDASSFWRKMRKSLGSKRKELSPEHIADITRIFGEFRESTVDGVPISRIFKNEDFGYRTFNRHFYVFKPPRPLTDIDAKLKVVTDRIVTMIGDLSK